MRVSLLTVYKHSLNSRTESKALALASFFKYKFMKCPIFFQDVTAMHKITNLLKKKKKDTQLLKEIKTHLLELLFQSFKTLRIPNLD